MKSTGHILLIEDNAADAELVRDTLEHVAPLVRLTVIHNGEQALAALRGLKPNDMPLRPDIVLLDLNLPAKDGRSVLSDIKSDPALRMLPVVILSSSAHQRDIRDTYSLGANCYITKPIELGAFQTVISNIASFWLSLIKLPGW